MSSNVLIEHETENGFKYYFAMPYGATYAEAFKVIEGIKQSVEQMQNNAIKNAEEAETKKEE